MKKLVRVRPLYEIQMFGGPGAVEIRVGDMVRLAPHCELFARGVRYAAVRSIGDETCKVRPYVGGAPVKGKLHTIMHDHILVDEKGIGT